MTADTQDPKLQSSGRQEPDRNMRISTRENAAFKWKKDRSVVGALEVKSFPDLNPREKLEHHPVMTVEDEFEDCLRIWKEQKMHKSFAEAVESIPPEMRCCGFINDEDQTIKKIVPLLNDGWAKKMTEEWFKPKGYHVSCFVWTWSNVSGAAENVKLLIRFHNKNTSRR